MGKIRDAARKAAKKLAGAADKPAKDDAGKRAAMHSKARALLEEFAGDLPHPEATLQGRYSFRAGDRWHGKKIGAFDGWYSRDGWSIRIQGGRPVDAVRADVERPKATKV